MWIASGDSYEKVLPVAYHTKILSTDIPLVHFNTDDADLISCTIKS